MKPTVIFRTALWLLAPILLAACGPSGQEGGDDGQSAVDDDATPVDDDTSSDDDNDDNDNDNNDTSPADDDEATPDIEFFGSKHLEAKDSRWYAHSTVYHWRGAQSEQLDWDLTALAPIWGSSADNVYVVGYSGSSSELPFYQFWVQYEGVQWTEVSRPGVGQGISAISGSSRNNVYQAAIGATLTGSYYWNIYRFDGAMWKPEIQGGAPNGSATLYGIWVAPSGEVFAVGDYQSAGGDGWLVVQNTDGAWREVRRSTYYYFYLGAVWGASPDDVFAVGGSSFCDEGSIGIHWDGTRWKRVDALGIVPYCLDAIAGLSSSEIYAVGSSFGAGGVFLHYDGETWTNIALPVASGALSLWVAGPSSVYLPLGTDGIWHWDGEQWTKTSDIDASYLWGYVHPPGERR